MVKIGVGTNRGAVAASVLVTTVGGGVATADIVAAWNFDNVEEGILTVDSTYGSGVLDLGPLGPVATTFQGTTLNAPFDWTAGEALAFVGTAPEGGGMTFSVDSIAGEIDVSFAARRSPTGARWIDAEFWDGWGWVSVDTFDVATQWTVHEFEIPTITDVGRLFVRLTPAGPESSAGTIRFDNLVVAGTVPAPGGVAMIAIWGMWRRRR